MRLTRSTALKVLVSTVSVGALLFAYQATLHDSKPRDPNAPPAPGDRFTISATAYCKGAVTAAGVAAQSGAAASDRNLMPLGSIIDVDAGDPRYDGLYTILDTGPEIKGHEVDIYMWSCYEALEFGRQDVQVTLVRRGWDPRAIAPPKPGFWDRVLGRTPEPPPAPVETKKTSPARPSAPGTQPESAETPEAAPSAPSTPAAEGVAGDTPPPPAPADGTAPVSGPASAPATPSPAEPAPARQ